MFPPKGALGKELRHKAEMYDIRCAQKEAGIEMFYAWILGKKELIPESMKWGYIILHLISQREVKYPNDDNIRKAAAKWCKKMSKHLGTEISSQIIPNYYAEEAEVHSKSMNSIFWLDEPRRAHQVSNKPQRSRRAA